MIQIRTLIYKLECLLTVFQKAFECLVDEKMAPLVSCNLK